VRPVSVSLQARGQLACGESGTFLDIDAVCKEQGQIRIDGEASGGPALLSHFEPVRTCVLLLVESHVPDLHGPPWSRANQAKAQPGWHTLSRWLIGGRFNPGLAIGGNLWGIIL
jgi:hypothetical protein